MQHIKTTLKTRFAHYHLSLAQYQQLQQLLLPTKPELDLHPPQEAKVAYKDEEEVPVETFAFTKGLEVGADGSAQDVTIPGAARASWAAVQRQVDGKLWALTGTVPPHQPQNAAVAEQMAATQAIQHHAQEGLVLDCAAVLVAANNDETETLKASNPYAGLWKKAWRQHHTIGHKTKAHVKVPENPSSVEEWRTWINDKADSFAKKAMELHMMDESKVTLLRKAWQRAQDLLLATARALADHKSPKQQGTVLTRIAKKQAASGQSHLQPPMARRGVGSIQVHRLLEDNK